MAYGETSKFRHIFERFCVGNGVDLGSGGDPITSQALSVDYQIEEYGVPVGDNIQWRWDCLGELPFVDNSLDFCFSSHLIEDAYNTIGVLSRWLRVIKPGGLLILLFPDERRFKAHCQATGQVYNCHHVHADMGLEFMLRCLRALNGAEVVETFDNLDAYNVAVVARKR